MIRTALFLAAVVVLCPLTAVAQVGSEGDTEAIDTEATVSADGVPTDTATAIDSADVEVTLDASDDDGGEPTLIEPFSLSFGITDTFTVGAIARDEYSARNFNLLSFSFGVGYATPIAGLSAELGLGFSKYLTESGGSVQQREGRLGDLSLGISYGNFYTIPVAEIGLSASLGFDFPTSEASRFTDQILAIGAGLSLSRSFGDLKLSYRIGAGKNFNPYTSVVADLSDFAIDVIARDGGTENIGEALVALDTGVLSEWSMSHTLSVSYSWFEGFSTAISFGLSRYWTYDNGTISRDDEFTSEFARPGRGRGDSMRGSISASYAFLDYFGASLSMSTSQSPLTADNQRVRFPFFDTQTGNLQNTSISLGLSASY